MFKYVDYRCTVCNEKFEHMHDGDEDQTPNCPVCESDEVKRILTYGGYQGNFGESSTRPKNSGAFRGRKS